MLEKLKKIKWGYILSATLIFIVGLSLIISSSSIKGLTITVGIIIAVYSLFAGIAVIITDKQKNSIFFGIKIAITAIALIFGTASAIMNEKSAPLIVSVISLVLITDGAFKLTTAAKAKKYDVGGWWILLSAAALTIVGSFTLLRLSGVADGRVIAVLLGVAAILDGICNLLSVYFVEEYEKSQEREIYYSVYKKDMESRYPDGEAQ